MSYSGESDEAGDLGGSRRNLQRKRGKSSKTSTSKGKRAKRMNDWDEDEERALHDIVREVLDENEGHLCTYMSIS